MLRRDNSKLKANESKVNGGATNAGLAGRSNINTAGHDDNASLVAQIATLEKMLKERTNDLQRQRADFENYRKQVEKQRATSKESAEMATVLKLLPLLDDLNRAFSTYQELAPIAKTFQKTLVELKLASIDTTPGVEFNPDLHDAVMVTGDGEKEMIAETLRPGYYYNGKILRPAMVKVARN